MTWVFGYLFIGLMFAITALLKSTPENNRHFGWQAIALACLGLTVAWPVMVIARVLR